MMQPSADDSHTVRAVFIIDPAGKIAALMYYPLSNGINIDEILRLVDSLQMTANHGRATPANWPNNPEFRCKPPNVLSTILSSVIKYSSYPPGFVIKKRGWLSPLKYTFWIRVSSAFCWDAAAH
jgi:hypothetical protein